MITIAPMTAADIDGKAYVHYQSWHIGNMGGTLLKENPREYTRCFSELIRTWIKYMIMRVLRIYELRRY